MRALVLVAAVAFASLAAADCGPVPCNGHGVCDPDTGTCTCDPYFAPPYCYTCVPGWCGPACDMECPGGANNPCNGHGTCQPSSCTCICGVRYSGTACDECLSGFFGYNCAPCPSCNGHGQCDDGMSGTGACLCDPGFDPATRCADCSPGFYGADCASECPGGAATPCNGNGTCDDGVNGTGTCTCRTGFVEPDCATCTEAAPCDDGDLCSENDVCTGGVCAGTPRVCAPCDACFPAQGCAAAPRSTCTQSIMPLAASLLVKNRTPDTKDLFVWKWKKGGETTVAEFGDPSTTEDYRLCVYRSGATALALDVPAGGTCGAHACWRATKTGFTYRDEDLTPSGVEKLRLKAGVAGKASILLKGEGPNLGLPAPSSFQSTFLVPLNVQLQAESGSCWEVEFDSSVLSADGTTLEAPAD